LEGILPDSVTGLIDIRDNRLYRETHDTFEAYCGEKLHITRRQADRLIAAFPIQKALADAGLPKLNEGAAREVADLPPPKAVEVVKAAKDENPDGKLTAENVRKARDQIVPRKSTHKGMIRVGDQHFAAGMPEAKAELARRAQVRAQRAESTQAELLRQAQEKTERAKLVRAELAQQAGQKVEPETASNNGDGSAPVKLPRTAEDVKLTDSERERMIAAFNKGLENFSPLKQLNMLWVLLEYIPKRIDEIFKETKIG
jgi:hypothetical protein